MEPEILMYDDGIRRKRVNNGVKIKSYPLCVGKNNTCPVTTKIAGNMCADCKSGKHKLTKEEKLSGEWLDENGRRVIFVNEHKRYLCSGKDNACVKQVRDGAFRCSKCADNEKVILKAGEITTDVDGTRHKVYGTRRKLVCNEVGENGEICNKCAVNGGDKCMLHTNGGVRKTRTPKKQ